MIECDGLSKRFGGTLAVDGLSFRVEPGRVTGFLGPNGAGKSTTMRLVLGLDAPTSGCARLNGRRYRDLATPMRQVGALLEARAFHGGRSAHDHLVAVAYSNGIGRARVNEVLHIVGLTDVGRRRASELSLGMAQRLGIGVALLGDPGVLILDEPVNGLDTDGIRWMRDLMKRLASEGRTVFLSSHMMSEMELTADHLVVIGRGRLLADVPMRRFIERHSHATTRVSAAECERLRTILEHAGAGVAPDGPGVWRVSGPDARTIGALAAQHHVGLDELTPLRSSLEEAYMELVHASTDHRAVS
jgi:ABC-2 type transport system ATP-binding protein